MSWISKTLAIMVILTGACAAQDSPVTVVDRKGHHSLQLTDINKLYLSAFSAVQQEFGMRNIPMPSITLIVGEGEDHVEFDKKTIVLSKWNRGRFVEGVVVIAFEEMLSVEKRFQIANHAMQMADATIDVTQFARK
ncbi:MAG TPA: hypothetical protein VMT82_07005 [candidate division Zixibacteria bacterium]|nr:hypothetical protein [candidate division Zixibacteria bacterium]